MPYIKSEDRKKFDDVIFQLVNLFTNNAKCEPIMGEINYVFSSVIWRLFKKSRCYSLANSLIGVLECIKIEFYRRQIFMYEEEKIEENGDI
jgi:hypothetical protein